MIYTTDHEPMHVHVFKAGASVVINLIDLSLRDVYMDNADVRRALSVVEEHRSFLMEEWIRIGPSA